MIFASSYHNIISPLGLSSNENYEAVRSGISPIKAQRFSFSSDPFCVARIDDSLIEKAASEVKNATPHTRLELLSLLSVQDVLRQSGLNNNAKDLGLIYTTTKGNIDLLEGARAGVDPERVYLPVFANYLQQQLGLANKPLVVSNACISGLLGIIMAQRFIEQKRYRHVIVCGGDILSEFTLSGFKSFNALSPEACKPFDANRTGINLGEAVSSILITADEVLAGREKTQLVRGASANDANHISGPSRTGDGLLQAIRQTLPAGGILPGFISAHGTATPYNDEMESIAFERAGLTTVPVNSLKGYYGHTLGAAGVLETVISLMALHRQTFIKSAGYESKGVSGQIQLIDQTRQGAISSFLKTASGFGGCNGAALFVKA